MWKAFEKKVHTGRTVWHTIDTEWFGYVHPELAGAWASDEYRVEAGMDVKVGRVSGGSWDGYKGKRRAIGEQGWIYSYPLYYSVQSITYFQIESVLTSPGTHKATHCETSLPPPHSYAWPQCGSKTDSCRMLENHEAHIPT